MPCIWVSVFGKVTQYLVKTMEELIHNFAPQSECNPVVKCVN